MEEINIIRKCQLGDMEAFNELYRLYIGRAMRTAYYISGNKTTAEDIVQEAFTEAYMKLKSLRTPETFYRWFYIILVRTGWRMVNKSKKILPVENIFEDTDIPTFQESVEETVEVRERNLIIRNALGSLSVPVRTAVVLYYYNDMTIKDISKIMGCFQGTVKSRLFQARLQIKKSLTKQTHEELFDFAHSGKECMNND
ncbi:MAG: RNA polymerase sigma factor [Clostridia bacterium]|nr:RNA polymerase sigma factor [Clostridia bacterium]